MSPAIFLLSTLLCYTVQVEEETINLDGKTFRLVKQGRRGEVGVYTDGELYARVGEWGAIDRMAALHKKFDEFGFPVPEIVGRGDIGGQAFFLEKSLGEKCFSYLFQADIEKYGRISPELFEKFLSVSEKFTRVQLRSKSAGLEGLSIKQLIRPEDLAEELPEYGEKILKLFDEAVSAMSVFPLVLTHGDFNPHNLFPGGVIDFEKTYYGPAGYDLVSNVFSITYFPKKRERDFYEHDYFQHYSFTFEQRALYYTRLDALYTEAGLPKLSDYRKNFEYCRAIWATKQNFRAPKLQKWRYELFKKNYLR